MSLHCTLSAYLFSCSCFFLLLLLLVLYFQISHLEPFFTDTVFRFSFHDSVSGFRIAGLVLVLKAVVKFYFLWV